MRSLFLISALVFAAPTAQAALTITSISGVSNSVIVPNTTAPTTPGGTTTPATGTASATVYGGTAGHLATPGQPSCAAITDFRQPCDSCGLAVCADNTNATPGVDQAPLCACNRRRVYDGLIISIAVTRAANETPQGPIKAVVSTGGVSGTQEMQYVTTPSANVSYVDFTWQNLCSKLQTTPATTSCEGANGTVVVTIFSDKNNDGIATGEDQVNVTFKIVSPGADYNIFGEPNSDGGVGDFLPFPGDDRIYLTRLDTTTNFPNLAYGSVGTAVKVLLSNVSLDKATPKDRVEPETDLAVASGTAELDQDYIDDVKNGTTYYVRLAVVDQANNMVQFFPDNLGTDKAGVDNSANCNGATANSTCPFAVIPDQVLGLLSKDFNCFIATAAYGSSLEPKLKIFRDFRQQILLTHEWGKNFVIKYYDYGPYAARYIHDKPVLRAITRGILWPLAGFSWLALQIGLVKSLILSMLLLTLIVALPVFGSRRFFTRA